MAFIGFFMIPIFVAAGAFALFVFIGYLFTMLVQMGMGITLLMFNRVMQRDAGYAMTRKKGQVWRNVIGVASIAAAVCSLGMNLVGMWMDGATLPSGYWLWAMLLMFGSYLLAVALGITMIASGVKIPRGMWKVMKRVCIVLGVVMLLLGMASLSVTGILLLLSA